MDHHHNMSPQFLYQQVPSTYTNFSLQENIFSPSPSQMFCTSKMTPPSAFHPTPTIHCYRPTMPLMGSEILSDDHEEENNDDENPPPLKCLSRQRIRSHVRQDLINSSFIFRLVNYIMFKLYCHVCFHLMSNFNILFKYI